MKINFINNNGKISYTGIKNKKIEHLFTFDKDTLKFIKRDIFEREITPDSDLSKRLNPKIRMITKYMKGNSETIDFVAFLEKQHNGELDVVNTISGS